MEQQAGISASDSYIVAPVPTPLYAFTLKQGNEEGVILSLFKKTWEAADYSK